MIYVKQSNSAMGLCSVISLGAFILAVFVIFIEDGNGEKLVGIALSLIAILFIMLAGVGMGEEAVAKELASEIDLNLVPVKGQKEFEEKIKIVYVDGKLKSVELISKEKSET